MDTLAERMRKMRNEKDLSLAQVAKRLGVPVSTYKEWEYGRAIQGEPYERIARCFDISLSELMTGQKPQDKLTQLKEKIQNLKKHLEDIERDLLTHE